MKHLGKQMPRLDDAPTGCEMRGALVKILTAPTELDLGKYISGTYPPEHIIEAFDTYPDRTVM